MPASEASFSNLDLVASIRFSSCVMRRYLLYKKKEKWQLYMYIFYDDDDDDDDDRHRTSTVCGEVLHGPTRSM